MNKKEIYNLIVFENSMELKKRAVQAAKQKFKNEIYIRGLIEISSYCKNDCLYCGIRKSNCTAERYRLTDEQIFKTTDEGYAAGFRTFVLQGGEDIYFNEKRVCEIVYWIKNKYTDCAVTLSLGEKSKNTYKEYKNAGADRYLLRHETADKSHYRMLHPTEMDLNVRKNCLYNLKEIGFQVGSGFMVGSPFQTIDNLCEDIAFLKELNPHMIGIGPFIKHNSTPFKNYPNGSLDLTLKLISILRVLFPNALIPATTALATVNENGRELGILSGANVVMPNITPMYYRKKYMIYSNKLITNAEAVEGIAELNTRLKNIGYTISTSKGDYCEEKENENV